MEEKTTLTYILAKIKEMVLAIADIKPSFKEECPIGIIDFEIWEWTQGVGLYTLWQYYKLSGNKEIRTRIEKWFEARFQEGLPEKNVNTMCPMLTMACLYEETQDEKYLPYLHEWANFALYEMTRTQEGGIQHKCTGCENKEQLWDDTLYMTVLFMAKYGVIFDKKEFLEESEYQFLLHIKYLSDRQTGLWYHGWSFERGDHFANALWARGNSWLTAGIPDYLEIASPTGATRKFILQAYCRQAKALLSLQDESGLWHTLLDDKSSYLESSASANFAYRFLKGVRLGVLSKDYENSANRAISALLDCVNEQGVVEKCSYGTGMGMTLQDYRDIPICPMPYGQTLTILALMEYVKSNLNAK